ncbi:NifU family protein [Rhizobium laguerreae]|nr:NifU family protein [Rhizobium laguerreae]
MFVRIDPTPNPLTRKFSFDVHLTDSPYEITRAESAPEALGPLFAAGVVSVFVARDYLSLTVADENRWPDVQKDARTAIAGAAEALASLSRREEAESGNDPVTSKIKGILETRIRPAVANDGGDVRFHSFDEKGVLHLEMAGACSGCPSSSATLKHGILNMMRHFVPEVLDVEAVAR